MESDEQPSRYPYLISVRGGRPIPAHKDGSSYLCAYQTQLGLWWAARDVRVLEYDPHRDFYREMRQAYLAAHPASPTTADTPAPDASTPTAASAVPDAAAGWEQVASRPVRPPAPVIGSTTPTAPRRAWGR